MLTKEVVAHCKRMITKGSKSFSLASRLFDKETRDAAFCLYGWCRYCDDVTDGSTLGHRDSMNKSPAAPLERIEELKKRTEIAYEGGKLTEPVFIAFQAVVKKYNIPIEYPLELLEGMAMDLRNESYETIQDLMLYCYRVAGVVGLMMSHIMGVRNEKALLHAASLGKAMQLTNISRDILEDAQMGRVYIPQDWLRELGLDPREIMDPKNRHALASIVKRLLAVADILYQSGDRGLPYLSIRHACTISAARHVYSEIGRKIQSKKDLAWDSRVIVSISRKCWVMSKGIAKVIGTIPHRIRDPWKRCRITIIWRNQ